MWVNCLRRISERSKAGLRKYHLRQKRSRDCQNYMQSNYNSQISNLKIKYDQENRIMLSYNLCSTLYVESIQKCISILIYAALRK